MKRRPGRPPGAKNKKKQSFALVPLKPRARPSIKQESMPYNDGGHGVSTSTPNQTHRPIVEYDTNFASQSQSSIDYSFSHTDSPSIANENAPLFDVTSDALAGKKRPGRPRKHPVKPEPLVKRRPGRPPGAKTRRYQHSDVIDSVDVPFDEPPKQRLRGRPSAQPNWVDSDSDSDSHGKCGSNVTKNKSSHANDTQTFGPRRVGRPPGAKNKKNINFRPIKIELIDSIPNDGGNQSPASGRYDQASAFQANDHSDNPTASTSMSQFCKPFEIQLEDIYNSSHLQNLLHSPAQSAPTAKPTGSGNKYH